MLFEDLHSTIKRFIERLLFAPNDLLNMLMFRADFGEDVAEVGDDDRNKFIEKRLAEPESTAKHRPATENSAHHCVSDFVPWFDAISNCKAQRADVVSDDPERN